MEIVFFFFAKKTKNYKKKLIRVITSIILLQYLKSFHKIIGYLLKELKLDKFSKYCSCVLALQR